MGQRTVVGVVFGTRPEAIKLAPVIFELQRRCDEFHPILISTAQHRQMLDQVLNLFAIRPDCDLDIMQPNQTLSSLTARVLNTLDAALQSQPLDLVMVQGDTTTAFATALAAFYRRIPVAHVEAGLRSRDLCNPYPEEANRRLASVVTELHFPPTQLAMQNLVGEGVPEGNIAITGNTVVDAVHWLVKQKVLDRPLPEGIPDDGKRLVLVTSHRRESWGHELENICNAILDLVNGFEDVRVIYPVHMNPNVQKTVFEKLAKADRVHLTKPLDYFEFLALLRRCDLVLTDSGGVQEEAPTFGKPVLVLRKVTERPEASLQGRSRIIGTSREAIVEHAWELLTDRVAYAAMAEGGNPYGDGLAAKRIVDAIARWRAGMAPLLEAREQFQGTELMEEAAA